MSYGEFLMRKGFDAWFRITVTASQRVKASPPWPPASQTPKNCTTIICCQDADNLPSKIAAEKLQSQRRSHFSFSVHQLSVNVVLKTYNNKLGKWKCKSLFALRLWEEIFWEKRHQPSQRSLWRNGLNQHQGETVLKILRQVTRWWLISGVWSPSICCR